MVKKKHVSILFILVILAALYFLVAIPYTDKVFQKEYDLFYLSNLEGTIDHVGIKHHGVSFRLRGVNNEYVFYPFTDEQLNGSHIFGHIAEPGDKLIKPSKSDTLLLIHAGKTLKYTFQKPEGEAHPKPPAHRSVPKYKYGGK
jgi:hypothetical protein